MEAVCSFETWCKNHKDSHHCNTAATAVLSLVNVGTVQDPVSALRCLVAAEGQAVLFSVTVTDCSVVRFFIMHVMCFRHEMMCIHLSECLDTDVCVDGTLQAWGWTSTRDTILRWVRASSVLLIKLNI